MQRGLAVFAGCAVGVALGASVLWLVSEPATRPAPIVENNEPTTIVAAAPKTGDILEKDCAECPEMVFIMGGTFTMGSPDNEKGRDSDEKQREVTVKDFAIARTEVTFDQWDACVDAGGCSHKPDDAGWGRGSRPVMRVSWNDAQEYIAWLNTKVEGAPFRLPSETEWEYAARAGTTTPYSFGETISADQANFGRTFEGGRTSPIGSYPENAFGLHDMHGNVWEWVEDVYADYDNAPTDGSAYVPQPLPDGHMRVLRGGSWGYDPLGLRSAIRGRNVPDNRGNDFGFRPARTLLPL